jgi:CRISPR-associated protein Csm1
MARRAGDSESGVTYKSEGGTNAMLSDRQKNDIALAGLLHDIGKFKQRAGFDEDEGKTHSAIGHEWLASIYGDGLIAAGARNHHGVERETWDSNITIAIYEADNCSASERSVRIESMKETSQKWHREVQLAGVFGRVRNPAKENPTAQDYPVPTYSPLCTVDLWSEPVSKEAKNDAEAYRKLWHRFNEEFQKLKEYGNHHNVAVVMHLLEKYTSFIPSITLKTYGDKGESLYHVHPDVSLYDHLKTTAAITSSLVDYVAGQHPDLWDKQILKEALCGAESKRHDVHPFLLIGGDISGVQKFIYTISSKGALKSLKGRSFFLELFTEHAVQCLLDEMHLSRCNVIFTGGGHFYVLVPNLHHSEMAIKNVRQSMNEYLFEAFNGGLQLFIEGISFGKQAFADTAEVWTGLSSKLEKSKQKKWGSQLDDLLAPPAMPNSSCLTESCQVCGREDLPLAALADDKSDVLACEHCQAQYLVGDSLQKATRKGVRPLILKYTTEPAVKGAFRIAESFYQIIPDTERTRLSIDTETLQTAYHVNSWSIEDYRYLQSRPLLASIYIPTDNKLRDLENLVESGFGMDRLAALRMDVDRLGRVFSSAVSSKERKFSRMAAMSRNLSLFFKYHLDGILEGRAGYPLKSRAVTHLQNEERRLLTVYAGGDDLFLLGHWLDVTEAAYDIERGFLAFTGNPFMTVSGGITLGGVHDPVYRLADWSGSAESRAKNGDKGRCRITLFDHYTVTWKEMAEVRRLLSLLVRLCEPQGRQLVLPSGSVSRSFLYRLLTLAREHRKSAKGQWILPKIAYLFGRFVPDKNFQTDWQIIKNEVFSLDKSGDGKWTQLEIALVWLLMLTRKGGE